MHSEAIPSAVTDAAHQTQLRARDVNLVLLRGLSRLPNLAFLPAEEQRRVLLGSRRRVLSDPHFNQLLLSMTTSEHRRSLRSAFSP